MREPAFPQAALAEGSAANRWQAETLKESAVFGARLAGKMPALRKTR